MIQLWSAAAVIGNKHCFTRCCGGEDISFVLKHISAVLCLLVVSSYLSTNPQWGGQKCKESTQVRNMSLQFGWNGLHPRDTQIVGLLGQEKIEILLLHPPLNMGRAHHLREGKKNRGAENTEGGACNGHPYIFSSLLSFFAREGKDWDPRLSSSTRVYL